MKHLIFSLCAGAALSLSAAELPGIAPYAKFADGLLTKTKPTGWIRTFCERQATGLTGHPEALRYPYDTCLWNGPAIPRRPGRRQGMGWWPYEQSAYYVDGLLRLGYTLGDAAFIEKGEKNVDYVLEHASDEGRLGNPATWDGKKFRLDPPSLMWPMAVFFRAMKAKYEKSPDPRIPAALSRYYLLHSPRTVANYRNLISVEGMLWTYGLTGETQLLANAEQAWNSAPRMGRFGAENLCPSNCVTDRALLLHGVTYCEELKVPMLLAAYTGKRAYFEQGVRAEANFARYHMLPDGCPSSTEETRGNSVSEGHETCDTVDYTWSLGYALEATGDARYADRIERCVFNAGFGAITKDFRHLQYFSNPNQFRVTGNSNPNLFGRGSTWGQYRPNHQVECCAGNVHRLMPNYVSRMWLRNRDGAPVAALYGPSEVDYGFVKIVEETAYPFDGTIRFRFTLPAEKEFSFSYRVPGWCQGATLAVNGTAEATVAAAGTFGTVRRTFKTGDVLELTLPMEVRFETQAPRVNVVVEKAAKKKPRKVVAVRVSDKPQGVVVARGPLVYAYPIATTSSVDRTAYKPLKGKESRNPEFRALSLKPNGPFNYALASRTAVVKPAAETTGYPLDLATVPVRIEVPVRRIAWALEEDRFTPDMPETVTPVSDEVEKISLVPYGATCLRLTVFPEIASAGAENKNEEKKESK